MQPFITSEDSSTHQIRPGDPHFNIYGKFTVSRRASIEITDKCPANIGMMIANAIEKGYVIPVATITKQEKLFIGLTNE